jgi:hypothetical protein
VCERRYDYFEDGMADYGTIFEGIYEESYDSEMEDFIS